MADFFGTLSNATIPTSRIWSIYPRNQDSGPTLYEVRLDHADGPTVSIYSSEYERLVTARRHYLPAQSSTYKLGRVRADHEHPNEVWKELVIAWTFDSEGTPAPLTTYPNMSEQVFTVLMPDGSVVDGTGDNWRSLDAWFIEKQKEVREAVDVE